MIKDTKDWRKSNYFLVLIIIAPPKIIIVPCELLMMILLRLQCGEKKGRGYSVDAVYTDAVSAAMPPLIALTLQLVDIIILGIFQQDFYEFTVTPNGTNSVFPSICTWANILINPTLLGFI